MPTCTTPSAIPAKLCTQESCIKIRPDATCKPGFIFPPYCFSSYQMTQMALLPASISADRTLADLTSFGPGPGGLQKGHHQSSLHCLWPITSMPPAPACSNCLPDWDFRVHPVHGPRHRAISWMYLCLCPFSLGHSSVSASFSRCRWAFDICMGHVGRLYVDLTPTTSKTALSARPEHKLEVRICVKLGIKTAHIDSLTSTSMKHKSPTLTTLETRHKLGSSRVTPGKRQ